MLLAYVKSDIGLVRETNEDSYVFVPPHLFLVADGMGGHVAGEVASSVAANAVKNFVQQNIATAAPGLVLEQAIMHANALIFQMALEKNEYSGMGTTMTAVYIMEDTIYWAHVGDSRFYLLKNDPKTIYQITNDHSLVWELMQNGNITAEEAKIHPQRNMLTRAVGTSFDIKVDTGITTWESGDIILLCTDGLTNMVSEQTFCQLFLTGTAINQQSLDILIAEAKQAGGTDNITAVITQHGTV
ncbi:MAG: Stp1/IreP family PP2C-type Ser/Thr phosphatase [Veillonellales bacterium]